MLIITIYITLNNDVQVYIIYIYKNADLRAGSVTQGLSVEEDMVINMVVLAQPR